MLLKERVPFCNGESFLKQTAAKPALLFVGQSIVDQSIVDHSPRLFSHFGQFKSGFTFQNNDGVVMKRISKFKHGG